MRTGHTSPGVYQIRVQGRLSPRWFTWFDGYTVVSAPDGTTVISGTVADQAALHGLLQSVRDLGLPLVSVTQPLEDDIVQPPSRHRDTGTPAQPAAVPAQEEPR